MDHLELFKFTVLLTLSLVVLYSSMHLNKKRRKRVSEHETINEDSYTRDMRALGKIILGILGFYIVASLFLENSAREHHEEVLSHFHQDKELICSLAMPAKSNNGYLVSKKSGWHVSKNTHFIKGDIIVAISSCELR
jgi:hypothetical protein